MNIDIKSALKACTMAAALGAVATPAANAALILEISDGTTTKTIEDGGTGDLASREGIVTFHGSIGEFFFNISTGSSKPAIGSATEPRLALNSVDISGAAGELTIRLTDTDFVGPINDSVATATSFSGITSGVVTLDTYIDNSNAEFGTTTELASFEYGKGHFSDGKITYVPTNDPFSLTLVTTIEHFKRGDLTQLNALVSVPEPGTLGMVGMVGASLVLVQVARRRRSSRKS